MINQKLEALVGLLEKIAADKHDGHVTLFKFSTGWKVFEGTPTLLWPDCAVLAQMEPHESLSEALAEFVRTRPVPVDRSHGRAALRQAQRKHIVWPPPSRLPKLQFKSLRGRVA